MRIDAVFSTGDKNSHMDGYGAFVKDANGEIAGVDDIRGIDWIVGWPGENIEFSRYNSVRTKRIGKITDHPLCMTDAEIK